MSDAIRTGDYIKWQAPQFRGGSFFRGRITGKPKFIGYKNLEGTVIRHSYGKKTHQHTFTIQLPDGKLKLVKGRNLYPNIIEHIVNELSPDRVT